MKACPYCAEEIQDAAVVCKHCGRELLGPNIGVATVAAPARAAKIPWLVVLVGAMLALASSAASGPGFLLMWGGLWYLLKGGQLKRIGVGFVVALVIAGIGEAGRTSTPASTPATSALISKPPVAAAQTTPPAPKKADEDTAARAKELSTFVETATTAGLIHRMDANGHKVQVNPGAWSVFDADAKKGFALSMAAYCDLKSEYKGKFVDIIDGMSGKKVASVGAFGFSVY